METAWHWLIWFLFHRVTRYVASWAVCVIALYLSGYYAWESFDDPRRRDGNNGHTTIDFGGQWLMGAMLVEGQGPHLYHRGPQRYLLHRYFPYEDEIPDERRPEAEKGKRDAEELMSWFMGRDSGPDESGVVPKVEGYEIIGSFLGPLAVSDGLEAAVSAAAREEWWTEEHVRTAAAPHIGGPLYPPVHSLYMAPLALLRPRAAYRTNQMLCLVWALAGGLGVSYLTRRKLWWPVATVVIVVYPGFKGAILLGQNAPLTLCILIWGWALLARGHPIAGGIVWGFFAFKPVWAAVFFLVPLLTGRVRFCLAMLSTGVVLGLATVPFVGIHSWLDWLSVGREAAKVYNTDQNWIFLSRDLLGIPRRWLLDFSLPGSQRDRLAPAVVGWTLWALVLELTLMLTVLRWRQRRETTGPAPAFLFLGAWMLCYHFMYYDSLLSILPFFLLCAEPRRFLEPILIAFVPLPGGRLPTDLNSYYRPRLPGEYPSPVPLLPAGHRNWMVLNRMAPTVLLLMIAVEHLFTPLNLGVSVTGYWSPGPREATIQWEETTGPEPSAKKVVTATGKWPERPFKISSSLYGEGQPWDTYVLIFLWVWCGGLWLRSRPALVRVETLPQSVADVILVPLDDPISPAIRPA